MPLTLLAIALSVGISLAVSVPVIGFMLAEAMAAMSITLRLTWDKRGARSYMWIVAALALAHVAAIILLSGSLSRSAGGVYMLVALGEAALLTTLIRVTLRDAG